MKSRKSFIAGLILGAVVAAGLVIYQPLNATVNERPLKEACIKAVIQAIGMEIKSDERKLEAAQNGPGDPSNIKVFKKRIEELKSELEKYRAMDPESYVLPEKKMAPVHSFFTQPAPDWRGDSGGADC